MASVASVASVKGESGSGWVAGSRGRRRRREGASKWVNGMGTAGAITMAERRMGGGVSGRRRGRQ